MYFFLSLIIICSHFQSDDSGAWAMHTIDASSSGADGVKLGDINNDGLSDIVTGWEEGGITKLYLHPGSDKVTNLWPSVIVGKTPNVEDAVFADMNNDGQLDVVSCSENDVEKIFVQFSPKDDLLNPEQWTQSILPVSDIGIAWMYAEALQLDNKNGTDLIAAGKGENAQLGWFEAPNNIQDLDAWQWHTISPVGWVMSIILRDMDGDDDIDIVISDRRLGLQSCRWLENPGVGELQTMPWTNHVIGAQNLEVMFMTIADLDLDGIEEVIVAERTEQTIRIFRRLNEQGTVWNEEILKIPSTTGDAKSVEVGDINGDGVPDLVLSTNTGGKPKVGLSWIDGTSLNDRDGEYLVLKSISGSHDAKYDKAVLADVDLDGDLDVLICEENFGENSRGLGVVWYENPYN